VEVLDFLLHFCVHEHGEENEGTVNVSIHATSVFN
jgi:hypothetical protein